MLVSDPRHANSNTDTDKHPMSDTVVNIINRPGVAGAVLQVSLSLKN